MPHRHLALGLSLLLAAGCLWPVRQNTDWTVNDLAARPFDLSPEPTEPRRKETTQPDKQASLSRPDKKKPTAPPTTDVQTTAYMEADTPPPATKPPAKLQLEIPADLPGAEAELIRLPVDKAARAKEIERLFAELPPLTEEPKPLPGPEGRPYSLADLQQLAATNSPTLRQAAADVENAKGALIQARTYPNPTVGFEQDPNNNNNSAGTVGMFVDQPIKTGGKLKLQAAAAEMDLRNAELALKRVRNELATQVRSAYFNHLMARESVRITRSLARFTDEIYRLQAMSLAQGFAAPYEASAMRAQAYTARLAHKQAVSNYIYTWKQLVAAIGMPQAPLTELAGRIDRLIPTFDYDTVLERVLQTHTDVLSARNTIDKARYQLKLAQVTPVVPDVDVRAAVLKEVSVPPYTWMHAVQIGVPLPIWDQNRGNIISSQANLERAREEPHRVQVTLTNNLASAFAVYKNNVVAIEYYRRVILPDLVRTYRGVFERRKADPNLAFSDLLTAQQNLATNVNAYLSVLGSLWTSVVNVADFLQTDDLFQTGDPLELPALPSFEPWPCGHPAHCEHSAVSIQPSVISDQQAPKVSDQVGQRTNTPRNEH